MTGYQHSSLLVKRHFLGIVEKIPLNCASRTIRKSFEFLFKFQPFVSRIDKKAGLKAPGDIEYIAQLLTIFRREDCPPLRINRMPVLSVKHLFAHPTSGDINHFTPHLCIFKPLTFKIYHFSAHFSSFFCNFIKVF